MREPTTENHDLTRPKKDLLGGLVLTVIDAVIVHGWPVQSVLD